MSETRTVDMATVEEVTGRVVADLAATAGLQMTYLGIRTGLWKAMAEAGPLTPAELARTAGVAEPYARDWLRHQGASGYVAYDPAAGTFELPASVAAVLADDTQALLVEGYASMLHAMAQDLPAVEEAFRTGRGVGWHQRSAQHWHGMDEATQAAVVPVLVSQWLPALEGVDAKLRDGGKVADVGCGYGAALIAMAVAYPNSRFYGFDYHDASIAHARKAATEAGVGDRVNFEVATAEAFPGSGYDLVTFFDTFHDLGDPVAALRHCSESLASEGTVLLVEYAASDRLEENFNALGRLQYAASAEVCTPNAMAQGARDPLGTIPGEARLRQVAAEAGFGRLRRVPVEAPLNLLLELRQ